MKIWSITILGLSAMMSGLLSGAPARLANEGAVIPRSEHPRPDLLRENWMTLNGKWQFEIDKAADGESQIGRAHV